MGTIGALGLTLMAPWFHSQAALGLLAGATLHEVAQVLAVGAALGPSALDLATLAKLTRVALLAPTLLLLGVIVARRELSGAVRQGRRPPFCPPSSWGSLPWGGGQLGADPSGTEERPPDREPGAHRHLYGSYRPGRGSEEP